MATIKLRRAATAGASLAYGEMAIGGNELYFGNSSNSPIRLAKASELGSYLPLSGGILSGNLTINAGTYSDRYYQSVNNSPTGNLGNPTVTEMALFDEQFYNQTAFYPIANLKFYTSIDGSTWTENTSFTDTQKRKFLGGDNGARINIPNLTPYFRIEISNSGGYVFLNALYMYVTTQSHSMSVKIRARRRSDLTYVQITNSDSTVNLWPGHVYMPFSTIPFLTGGTSSGHYDIVHIDLKPTWSSDPNYSTAPIILDKLQIWGGYPAGKRNIFSTDENKNVTFPASLYTTGAFGTRAAAGGSAITHVPGFTSDPTSTTQTLIHRTIANFKTDLSLDNVTNESKATMFTSPTFTGTAAASAININGAIGIRASALGSTPTHILVVSADPSSTTRTVQTRTPAQLLSDIGAYSATNPSGYITSSGSITGNAGSVTNGVYTVGNQSIGGVKTFTSDVTIDTTSGNFVEASKSLIFKYNQGSIGGGITEKALNVDSSGTLRFGGTEVSLSGHTHTFASLTSKPTNLAGYGITDAMSTSHAANAITSTNIGNWNTAFGWGNHAGLYRSSSWVPTKADVGLGNVPNLDTSSPANIVQTASYRFVTDSEKATWNAKQNALGFTPYNATNPAGYITGNQNITLSGDASGSGTTSIALTLANSGVTAGTYKSVTVDSKGRVTGGTNPTTLSGYGITNAMSTSHAANAITGIDITNWNTAFGWGNHANLYRPVAWVPNASDITGLGANYRWLTDSYISTWNAKQNALGFTPYNATNPAGYITSSDSITGNAATATLAADSSKLNGQSASYYQAASNAWNKTNLTFSVSGSTLTITAT